MQKEINVPIILDAIKQAGDLFLKDFKKTTIPQDKQGFAIQLNDIEERCLNSLKDSLSAHFPETPWPGDEFEYAAQQQPLDLPEYWVCDSMDGAIQYMQHLIGWTINLVLVRDGRPHFAAIYDPMEQEMFWAKEGEGAFLNNQSIKPSAKTDPGVMLSVFEYPFGSAEVPGLNQKTGEGVVKLLNSFGVVRNYGPHGLQLAYVGAGRIDVFYQEGLDTYNWLPGILIAKEAGAEILTTAGLPWVWGSDSLLVAGQGIAHQFVK